MVKELVIASKKGEVVNHEVFRAVKYANGTRIFFDKNFSFHSHLGHSRRTKRFPYYFNLLDFMQENPDIRIFFTLNQEVTNFKKLGNDYLVNFDSYLKFCDSIQKNTSGRAKAFLGHKLKLTDVDVDEVEKSEFIRNNATDEDLIEAVRGMSRKGKKKVISLLQREREEQSVKQENDIDESQFIAAFKQFATSSDVQKSVLNNLPAIQLNILKENLKFLEKNLDKDETVIQNWIDEENGKYRKQRCLIFGIEYVDPKREGRLNQKRFDILAEQDRQSHILIELKSPNSNVFSIEERGNKNDGIYTDYAMSPDLARAIPQVLGYKKWYENANLEEIQGIGLDKKKSISKCVVVIGRSKEDPVWEENFQWLKKNINIEILTYTNLIDKLKNTISNLQQSSV